MNLILVQKSDSTDLPYCKVVLLTPTLSRVWMFRLDLGESCQYSLLGMLAK